MMVTQDDQFRQVGTSYSDNMISHLDHVLSLVLLRLPLSALYIQGTGLHDMNTSRYTIHIQVGIYL